MEHSYILKANNIVLRPVTEKDLVLMMNWRNKQEIRSNFIHQEIISHQQQKNWYSNYLIKQNDIMFIIEELSFSNKPIGSVAIYNIEDDKAEFGRLMVAEESARGKGYGATCTKLICKFAFEQLKLHNVYLQVFHDNEKAITVYESCGFRKNGNVNVGELSLIEMSISIKQWSNYVD